MKWARLLMIIFCFSLDVKVRAQEYIVENKIGKVEIDQIGESLDLQTFKGSLLRVKVGDLLFLLKEKSFVSVESSGSVWLHYGSVVIHQSERAGRAEQPERPERTEQKVKISTRHGIFETNQKGTYALTSKSSRSQGSVYFGQAQIYSRASEGQVALREGYSAWIGGLRSNGKRVISKLEPITLKQAEDNMEQLGLVRGESLKTELDHLRIVWNKAVEDIATQTQDQINGDMVILGEWQEENRKRDLASEKQKSVLINRFRAHALDLPLKNTEDPLE